MGGKDANGMAGWLPDGAACELIHGGAFVAALDRLESLACGSLEGEAKAMLLGKISDARSDCQMMCKSLVDGVVSGSLDGLFSHMRQRLYAISDSLVLASASQSAAAPRRLKAMARQDSDMADISALIADYKQVALLGSDGLGPVEELCQIADSQTISEFDARLLFSSVVRDAALPASHKAFVLGALCHNLISRHNRSVTLELVRTLLADGLEPVVYGRAAVALAADLLAWPQRWTDDAELLASLDGLSSADETAAAELVRYAIVSFAMQRLAATVEHIFEVEMQDEMNILVKKLIDKNSNGGSINLSEDDAEEIFGLKGKKLLGSLAKIEEWKANGVDVGFVSMKHLKSFPFFKGHVINWLRPFDPADPVVADSVSSLDAKLRDYVARSISATTILPDSDKYSLLFGMKGMGDDTVKEYCRILSAGAGIASRYAEAHDFGPALDADAALSVSSFVKDVYRAARLCTGDFGSTGIFNSQCGFFSSGLYAHLFSTPQLVTAGVRLVESRSWREAQQVYSILCANDGADVGSLRKYAFCLLKTSDTEAALEQLRKADIVDDSDIWTKRMIAECYISLGKYPQAAYAIEQARQLAPSDARVARLSARCNELLRRFKSALSDWRSLAYQHPDDAEAAVGVARCLLFAGNADEASEAVSRCPDGVEADKVKALLSVARLRFSAAKESLVALAKVIGAAAATSCLTQAADSLALYGVSLSHVLILADAVMVSCRNDGIK